MTYTDDSAPPGTPAIEAMGLVKHFGDHVVLDDLDLLVGAGEVYALLGPNGAGKSTLIRVLTTLSPHDGGVARVAGHDVRTDRMAVRRAISVTGQSTAVDPLLTGRENLQMVARIAGLGRRDAARRADELLDQFDLTVAADRRSGTYSGGMARRLDLAASLVVVPSVLFLDEPTTGLDTRSRQTMWRRIADLAAGGTTIFLTTQYLEEADVLADRIGVLDGGRLVAEGTAADLKARVGDGVLVLDVADPAQAGVAATVVGGNWSGSVVHLATDGSASHVRSVLEALAEHGLDDVRLRVHAPSLDDAFLALTGAAATTTQHATGEAVPV